MSLSLTGTWRTGLWLSSVQGRHTGQAERRGGLFGLRSCASLCLRSVSRVLMVLSFEPARRARRRFGPSPFRRSGSARRQRDVSQHAAIWPRLFVPADTRSGEGTARPGGAVA